MLPFTSDKLHGFLGYEGTLFGTQSVNTEKDELGEHTVLRYSHAGAVGKWEASQLKAGQKLNQPGPLFKKLDIKIVEEERARLAH